MPTPDPGCTRDTLLAYVFTLDPDVRDLFWWVERYTLTNDDTLDESWQAVAALENVFHARALLWWENTHVP